MLLANVMALRTSRRSRTRSPRARAVATKLVVVAERKIKMKTVISQSAVAGASAASGNAPEKRPTTEVSTSESNGDARPMPSNGTEKPIRSLLRGPSTASLWRAATSAALRWSGGWRHEPLYRFNALLCDASRVWPLPVCAIYD